MLLLVISGCSSKTLATVKTNEGNIEQVTISDIKKCKKENEARFDKLYYGADIEVVGTVKKIETNIYYNGSSIPTDIITFKEGFMVRLPYGKFDLADYNKGDKLLVNTNIYSVGIDVELLGMVGIVGYDKDSLRKTTITKVQ